MQGALQYHFVGGVGCIVQLRAERDLVLQRIRQYSYASE